MHCRLLIAFCFSFLVVSVIRADGRPGVVPAARSFTHAKVYVYVNMSGGIARFPIVHGVVSTQAVSTLNVPPGSFTVGADGTVYAAHLKSGRNKGSRVIVDVFSPGASGNATPLRHLVASIPFIFGGAMAVDAADHLFLSVLNTSEYAQNAHGKAKPIATAPQYGSYLAVDAKQNIYISNDNQGVTVWQPGVGVVGSLCLTDQAAGVATSADGTIFVAVDPRIKPKKHGPAIDVFSSDAFPCSGSPAQITISPQVSSIDALAEYEGYLFFTTPANDGRTVVDEVAEAGSNPHAIVKTFALPVTYSGLAIGP